MTPSLHVLIIDDDSDDTDFLVAAFLKWNADTKFTTCRNGQEAIEHLQQAPKSSDCPHLAFLDMHMPGKSGIQTLIELRAIAGCGDYPLMVISTSLLQSEANRCREAGCTDFFIKPASIEGYDTIVAAAIRHVVQRS